MKRDRAYWEAASRARLKRWGRGIPANSPEGFYVWERWREAYCARTDRKG
jgi:hypothetical protein